MSRPSLASRLWRTEQGLSAMLIFLVLALFVAAPLVASGTLGDFVFDILFSLLLLSGVVAVGQRRLLTIGVSVIVLLTLAVRWVSLQTGTAPSIWYDALTIVSLATLTALVLAQVFREGPITGYRIQGAIAAYLLLGLIWTSIYEFLYRLLPGSFSFSGSASGSALAAHGLAYFSFVTLTTVGYGDITPVHPLARSFSVAEALVGQLYPAILIGRLVSMELESRRRQSS